MPNQPVPQTPQAYLKLMSIIHIAMAVGLLAFSILALVVEPQKGIILKDNHDPFLCVVSVVAVAAFAASIFMYKKNVNIAINKNTLKEKLMAYQAAFIVKIAPLEGAALFGIVIYIQSGNLFYIIISGLIILYMLSFRPTRDRIENDLDLSYEDKILFQSDEILK